MTFAEYLVLQGEPGLAIVELQRRLDEAPEDGPARHLLFSLFVGAGRLGEARRVAGSRLELAQLAEAEGKEREAYQLYTGRDRLGFLVRHRAWERAEEDAEALGEGPLATEIRTWIGREKPRPDLARGLSAVLPGAGQVYAGAPGEAVGALVANGAWVGLAAWAALRRDWVGAAVVAGAGSRYYFGNVLHAGQAVEAREAAEDERFAKELETRWPWLRREN